MERILRRIESSMIEALIPSKEVVEAGGFLVMIDLTTDLAWVNYAVPREGYTHSPADIDRMITAFRERDRMPRLEFTRELWQTLGEQLEAQGFELEAAQPTMLLLPEWFQARIMPGVEVEIMGEKGDFEAIWRIGYEAFGMPHEPLSEEQLQSMRQAVREGRFVYALAIIEGMPAGIACTVGAESICELAGVGTLPQFRRRGIASTASTILLQKHFARDGESAWLSAGDEIATAVYERLGFRTVAERVNYRKPSG
jgi:ribosomal protein S18 acetylase RimI-like enzyme